MIASYVAELRYGECLKGTSKNGRLTKKSFDNCKAPPKKWERRRRLTAQEIMAVAKFNSKFITACYESELKKKAGIAGKLVVTLETSNMKVIKAHVTSQTGNLSRSFIM